MNTTIAVPIWVILVFGVFCLVWQGLMGLQTRNLRQLFEWYLDAKLKKDNE